MIKLLFKFISFILVLAILLIAGVYYYAGTIVKTAVEKFAPQVTQTAVKLNNVDLSLLSGRISLNGLSVANPNGYGAAKAFGLGNVVVEFDPKSILTDKIVINQILIDKTEVSVEATYKDGQISSNLTDIQKNVEAFLAQDKKANESKTEKKPVQETSSEHSGSSKQIVIRNLKIYNSELTVGIMKKTLTLPLPDIHQTNIGEKGKEMSWQDSVAYVFDLISTEAIKETALAAQEAIKEAALQALDITGAVTDNAKEAAGSLLDSAGKIGDSVKGLFGN